MEKIVATVACMAKGMQAYLSRCESDLLERSNHEVLAFVVAVACVAYGTGMQGYWSACESDLVHFVVCLVGALIGYIALCALVKIVAVKQTEGNQLLSKEVAWMAWLQRGAGSRPEQNQPLNIRVASFCRHLVTDEAIFIGTPVLVWTFQERIMFLPFALNINEIANGLMKWCVQRPRPYWVEKDIINPIKKQELDYSFPSSHAQTSASFATTLFMEFGVNPITLTISFLCVVVCISRITLGVHYPTDVAAGVFLGVILTYGLEKADVLNQFIEDLDLQEQLKALAIFFALIPTAFGLIRHLFQQDSATLAKIQTKDVFRSGNNKVNVHQMDATIRSLDKYSFTLLSLFGSGVGCVLMLQDNRNYTMQFPVSAMTLTEVMQSDFLWKRILLVGVPIMLSLFMMALVVPKKLTSNRGSNQATKFKCQILALSLKLIGSFLLGLWVMYGCPKCAWLLHWEDPLMACPASSSPESISFGDWYHHEQQTVAPADELKNRCLLSPFNHTAASPRYYATSKLVASVEELQATINTARRDGQVVRVVGAGWSDRDHFAANNRTMYISLVGPKLQGYQKLEEVGPQERPLVVAGAGIFIGGQQWLSGSLQVQWEDSLVHKLWLDGLALTSIPDAIGMTLGGLLSTGSDGWSFIDDMDSAGTPFEGSSNTISSSVLGFRYIDGMGQLREAWKNSTDNEFHAFGVSLGLAGTIYEVILSPVDAYCIQLSCINTVASVCPKQEAVRGQWHGFLRSGIDKYDTQQGFKKTLWKASKSPETGEIVCGEQPSLGNQTYHDNSFPVIFFEHPYSMTSFDFITEIVSLALRWLSQESCQSIDDLCGETTIRRYLEGRLGVLPETLGEEHLLAFEGCARSLVEQKRLKALGQRPSWQKEWWDKTMLMECYGKVMDHFGLSSDEEQQGVYRYYEGAFLHRAVHFHPQHNMEVYFPLEDNSKSGEEILCLIESFMEEEGHDRAGQQVDYYFSKTNDDFWMSPENGKSPMGGNATNTYTPGEVLRVNIYTHWVVLSQDKHTKFELFLEHFNSQNLTYTLNWAKALPVNPRLLSRVLENYPHLEEWKAFVRARDPHGVFLSDYWQKIFWADNSSSFLS